MMWRVVYHAGRSDSLARCLIETADATAAIQTYSRVYCRRTSRSRGYLLLIRPDGGIEWDTRQEAKRA